MPQIKILAIDPAMDNVGWMLLSMGTDVPFIKDIREPGLTSPPSPNPEWITEKDDTGVHTYQYFDRLDGGTFTSDSKLPNNRRMIEQADQMHHLVWAHQPDILCLEAQLDKGENKNPFGVALQIAITFPYFRTDVRPYHIEKRNSDRTLQDVMDEPFCGHPIIPPRWVIQIRPERLQSIAHYERKTTGREVVRRYKHLTGDKRRVSQHEADSMYVGVHAGRFWATCIKDYWPRTYLTTKEQHVFLEEKKGMLYRPDEDWWSNEG